MKRDSVTLTLIGGPTLLLEVGGLRLLSDPSFDPPQSYDSAGIRLTKLTGPSMPPEALGSIDAVLLSHDQHLDNLDRSGRAMLPRAGRVLTTVAGAARLGGNAEGLAPWSSTGISLADGRTLRVTAAPARHGPAGFEPIAGDVIGFILSMDDGPAIYVSGDTVWFAGVAEVSQRFRVALAVLFTGAAEPRGPFDVTMDTNDAIEAAAAFDDATVVAIHNQGWAHFTQSQEDVATAFAAVGLRSRLQMLEHGVPMSIAL
jgi:L-ascorbate metabolism protein UlaG (beta-lactamase superfamily)